MLSGNLLILVELTFQPDIPLAAYLPPEDIIMPKGQKLKKSGHGAKKPWKKPQQSSDNLSIPDDSESSDNDNWPTQTCAIAAFATHILL